MPTYRLPETCVTRPDKLDLALVAALMMWPDDPERREGFIDSTFVELAPPGMRAEAFELSKRSMPLSKFAKEGELTEILAHGQLAGSVLSHQIELKMHNHKVSKQKIISVLCDQFKSGDIVRIKPQHFHNKVWPKFGPVAHFWAARSDRAIGEDFPCRVTDLPLLLQDAEGFRIQGEKDGFLDASRTFKLPEDLGVPPAELVAMGKVDPRPFL